MPISIGDIINGFECVSIDYVEEIDANALQFIHQNSKAPVLVFECDDDNKVFCTYFRTPVKDDTGVPHILEHSVLNGSRKYPLKEPFLELIKASLYTFLNAMTYDDKTVYPVASRNSRDFQNLMDVYLDAVYYPNLTRETFMQEGWHYEVDDDRNIAFSGVVYNEMLGATSSPESILYDKLQSYLLPDSSYQYNSGGDPEFITDLTYEQFTDFHKTYYHPSNSKTVLYGNIDIAERLGHLAEYYDAFSYQPIDSSITTQELFPEPRATRVSYPITPGAGIEGKSFIVRGWMTGEPSSREDGLAMEILTHILTGTQASPLRRALIEAKLGEQTIQGLSTHTLDNYFIFGLKGTDEAKQDDVEAVIDSTLANLVKDGISERAVEAAVNTIEFGLRESNFGSQPKGLIYALTSAENWLYDKEPLAPLKYEDALSSLKKKISQGGFFEALIRKQFIENPHRLTLTMVPDETYETQRLERLNQRLSERRSTMAEGDIDALIRDCETVKRIQNTPDTPEALATIPKLPITDIDRNAEVLPFEIVDPAANLSFSEQHTRGIVYLKLHFRVDNLTENDLLYMPLFTQALLQTGTSSSDYVNFTQEIGIQTGGIGASFDTTPIYGAPQTILRYLECHGKCLREKIPDMLNLMVGGLTDSNLTDSGRIIEIIRLSRSRMEASIKGNGSSYAVTRAEAAISLPGRYNEVLGGVEQFRFLEDLASKAEESAEDVCAKLVELRHKLIGADNLRIHVTGGKAELAKIQSELAKVYKALPSSAPIPTVTPDLPRPQPNEGFVIPSKVQYVCKGLNFGDHGQSYAGHSRVMCKLLSSDYLWNKVRVQGNAYGCFCNFSMLSGTFYICSYRDPRLEETLETYGEIADYLETLDLPKDEFDKIIIGTMGKVDTPRSPSQKGSIAFQYHISGITQEVIQKHREEILDCSPGDIRAYAEIFRAFNTKGSICVFGNGLKLSEAKQAFSDLTYLFAED